MVQINAPFQILSLQIKSFDRVCGKGDVDEARKLITEVFSNLLIGTRTWWLFC